MLHSLDVRVIRRAGDLLAAGGGAFRAADVADLVPLVIDDSTDQVTRPGACALLVVQEALRDRAEPEAADLLDELGAAMRHDDPNLARWVAHSFAPAVLHAAADLLASAGRSHRVSKAQALALVSRATTGPALDATSSEARALLVARELLGGRLARDAQKLFDEMAVRMAAEGLTLSSATESPSRLRKPPRAGTRQ
jgi:hypothetical protein